MLNLLVDNDQMRCLSWDTQEDFDRTTEFDRHRIIPGQFDRECPGEVGQVEVAPLDYLCSADYMR